MERHSSTATPVLLWLLLVTSFIAASAWNPDAGVVKSLTKAAGARVLASSNPGDAGQANDGNDTTHWTSHGCMPAGFYLGNELSNILLHACQLDRCNTSSSDKSQLGHVTDNDTASGFPVRPGSGSGGAYFSVNLALPDSLREITVRGVYHAPVNVFVADGTSEKQVGTLTPADSHQTRDLNVTATPATTVTFRSAGEFDLQAVGALGAGGCKERLVVDLGSPRGVRLVRTRHWAGGHGLTSELLTSLDGVTWTRAAGLDPGALQAVVTLLDQQVDVRYLAVQHTQDESSWAKVYVWEIDAFDEQGPHGAAPAPVFNPSSFRAMLGVNGIWGWGTGRSSSASLGPGQGPAFYAPVASYGRNYHNLNWDVTDPDHVPDYDRMAQGHGTEAQPWLDWDAEYRQWRAANVSVHVSLQFTARDFPVSVWNHPRSAAFNYGQAFARHFGPTQGAGLVQSVEVGNEPWDYPPDFYRTVLEGMASGFKSGDPHLLVLPGAFQAHDPTDAGNYIGTRVTADVRDRIDAINSHHYSWRHHPDGSRHATYPEDPAGSFNEVRSIARWRNINCPTKPLWMTEWGWDSPGGGQGCSKFPECTSEPAAAAYAVRGLLLHARLGVARSTWFFYANIDDCDDHVFCRSGLTSSLAARFERKGPFHSLQHFLQLLGDAHFLFVLKEDEEAYVYVLGVRSPTNLTPTHLVAWRPVDAALESSERAATFTFDLHPAHAWRLSTTSGPLAETTLPEVMGEQWTMAVQAMPTVVELRHDGGLVG